MINYTNKGCIPLFCRIVQLRGSIFPKALLVAVPCGLLSALVKFAATRELILVAEDLKIVTNNAAWTAFSALVGFLVVFRTSQAYTRFWAGCSATHGMRMEWFNACCIFCSYARISKADEEKIFEFQGKLIRLFSLMHAAALAELEEINVADANPGELTAFEVECIDPSGLDDDTLRKIKASSSKVELLYAWIQMLIVECVDAKIIPVPPPVLSTALRLIAEGMNAFHDALRITYIPFPFPYAQTCDCLLVLHWIMTPLIIEEWVTNPVWAGILTFLQVFIVQALNFIAAEIEIPFGTDANDLDGADMQSEINGHLTMLLRSKTNRLPELTQHAITDFDDAFLPSRQSLMFVFDSIEDTEFGESERNGMAFSKSKTVPTPLA